MCSALRAAEWWGGGHLRAEMRAWEGRHDAEWDSTKYEQEQTDKKDFVKRHMSTTPMHY
jgi:hypothetical protein